MHQNLDLMAPFRRLAPHHFQISRISTNSSEAERALSQSEHQIRGKGGSAVELIGAGGVLSLTVGRELET